MNSEASSMTPVFTMRSATSASALMRRKILNRLVSIIQKWMYSLYSAKKRLSTFVAIVFT